MRADREVANDNIHVKCSFFFFLLGICVTALCRISCSVHSMNVCASA